jgi:hypothetical protein
MSLPSRINSTILFEMCSTTSRILWNCNYSTVTAIAFNIYLEVLLVLGFEDLSDDRY